MSSQAHPAPSLGRLFSLASRRERYGRLAVPRVDPKARTLHVIDIENLAGGPQLAREHAGHTMADFRGAVSIAALDQVVLGCNPGIAVPVRCAFPQGLLTVGAGPDGADRALLRKVQPDQVAIRFGRVVVGSGDGIFAGLAWELKRRGVRVVVVSLRESLSTALRRAADRVIYIEDQAGGAVA